MKRQILLLSILFLSACPQQQQEKTSKPDGPALSKVSAFPQENLACCWQELIQTHKDYEQLALNSYNDNQAALLQLFKISLQTTPTSTHLHGVVLASILNRLGDQRFSYYLQAAQDQGRLKQSHPIFSESLNETLRNELEAGFRLAANTELNQHSLAEYPLTAALLNYKISGSPSTRR